MPWQRAGRCVGGRAQRVPATSGRTMEAPAQPLPGGADMSKEEEITARQQLLRADVAALRLALKELGQVLPREQAGTWLQALRDRTVAMLESTDSQAVGTGTAIEAAAEALARLHAVLETMAFPDGGLPMPQEMVAARRA